MWLRPFESNDSRIPLDTPEFAADPHAAYREMRRRRGSLARRGRLGHAASERAADPRIWRGVACLPELRLTVPIHELTWRPGPFHRAMAGLPVEFLKSPASNL